MPFNPDRLTLARRRRGLTKKALAELTGIADRTITAYEGAERSPSDEALGTLSAALRFPKAFFEKGPFQRVSEDGVSFRAVTKLAASERDRGLAAAELAFELSEWLEARFELPAPAVPDLRHHSRSPEAAADALRGHWKMGDKPIPNLIPLLERKGVRVFSLFEDTRDLDAFSLWNRSTPFIFLNTVKSSERSRFDAAHELGHLVMHAHGAPSGRVAEQQADAFASAFLMPRTSVLAHATRHATVPSLVRLKETWGVSVAALAYRLNDVGLLSDWRYRQVCITLHKEGYDTSEPESMPRERSRALEKVFADLRQEGLSKRDIARDLSWPVNELRALVFQLVMDTVDGNGGEPSVDEPSAPRKLRLL